MVTPIKKFRDFLTKQKNVNKESDEEYTITFKYDDLSLIFESFEDDPYYYRFILPIIFTIDEDNKEWVDEEINKLTAIIKVARLFKVDKDVWVVADGFVYSEENMDYLFLRMISCLDTLFDEFKQDYFKWRDNKSEQDNAE